ncbi:MAG: hypothetical protein O3A59_07125 [Nitrospirae bacterium]|nr:hypothetical protein [Nitrospirota bacterium]
MENENKIDRAQRFIHARSLILGGVLVILSLGAWPFSGVAMGPPKQKVSALQIKEVVVDLEVGTLTILGQDLDLGNTLDVTLGELGSLLIVGMPTDTEIVAALPSTISNGDFLLTVSTGNARNQNDEYDLTIGAVGPEGPVGTAGDPGPPGAQGPPGAIGPQGLPGVVLGIVENFTVSNSTSCTVTCTRPETTHTGTNCPLFGPCTQFGILAETPACTATCNEVPAVADCGTAPNRFLVSCVTGSHSGGMAKSCDGAAPLATVTVPSTICTNLSGLSGCSTPSTCSCTTPSETGTVTDTQTATALCAEAS